MQKFEKILEKTKYVDDIGGSTYDLYDKNGSYLGFVPIFDEKGDSLVDEAVDRGALTFIDWRRIGWIELRRESSPPGVSLEDWKDIERYPDFEIEVFYPVGCRIKQEGCNYYYYFKKLKEIKDFLEEAYNCRGKFEDYFNILVTIK